MTDKQAKKAFLNSLTFKVERMIWRHKEWNREWLEALVGNNRDRAIENLMVLSTDTVDDRR